jgi:hypothetical protein
MTYECCRDDTAHLFALSSRLFVDLHRPRLPLRVILSPSYPTSEGHRCPLFLERVRNPAGVLPLAKCQKEALLQCGILRLFDDLVCAAEQCNRECKAESLGGLEVDNELYLRRPLDWKVSGFA